MSSNSLGSIFKMTTFGESHGKAVGVVIDGCPAQLPLRIEEIQAALDQRVPGRRPYTSPRRETDKAEILSGVFQGMTTGAPIAILIPNHDTDSAPYESLKNIYRPGHAIYTFEEKYGVFDYRGSGRASARETVCRVAAGAVAAKFLKEMGICCVSYLIQIGSVKASIEFAEFNSFVEWVQGSTLFCPDRNIEPLMHAVLEKVKQEGDSVGGVVEFRVNGLVSGLGDPVYDKVSSRLALALMSIPAAKGFEIGEGFHAAEMRGSQHNDLFVNAQGKIGTKTNHAGGLLGGITTGMPLVGRVAFKPASSIRIPQKTLNKEHQEIEFSCPSEARHDICVAIRAVPVVQAMVALTLADAVLMNRCARF